ncbi:MAG: NAD(P)-dependent oxidoreductase [Armatimonadota bacterium]|nr:NAD(P)-dependent oxidoreductase [Armatimonadota bacterium]
MDYGHVLLTGSEGFVGKAVARRLDGIIRCDTKLGLPIDRVIRSPDFARVRTVIHCAAVQLFTPGRNLYDYETFHRGNVVVLQDLLRACVTVGVRKFIHISTDMVYGIPDRCPIPESADLRPVGHYGRSKRQAETLVRAAAERIPVVTILRPRVIGGPGRLGLFATLARLAHARVPIVLIGSGGNLYQMLHVEDFADLVVEALHRDVPGTFNAGSLQVSTLREKIVVAAQCLGTTPAFVPVPERLAVAACAALYRLHLGPLHPEQYLTLGRNFVLSLERTLDHFAWRPRFSDNQIIADSFRTLARSAA